MIVLGTPFEVPLQNTPQTLSISLGGTVYVLVVRWNWVSASWLIDIADANGNPLVSGIPMVTGADLLEQFDYLGFTGEFIAQTDNNPDGVPTFTNLGSTGHLYFVVPD